MSPPSSMRKPQQRSSSSSSQRCLWKEAPRHLEDKNEDNETTTKTSSKEDEDDYESISQRFRSRPRYRPLFWIIANAVVVVQEFALTCFLLARHQVFSLWQQQQQQQQQEKNHPSSLSSRQQQQQSLYMDLSAACLMLALLLTVLYSAKADPGQDRKTKLWQRSIDGTLLAIWLRFIASVLQSLTASYSSDTVMALTLLGMAIHLLFCDYSYANGRRRIVGGGRADGYVRQQQQQQHPSVTTTATTNPVVTATTTTTTTSTSTTSSLRRPFRGGTISLNAIFFSTTLLVSRLVRSNTEVYVFVILSVVMFAIYPDTRHVISTRYPPSLSVVPWLITLAVIASTVFMLLILDEDIYVYAFVGINLALGLVFPMWKWRAQWYKVLYRGPWDIPTAASMQLDYTAAAAVAHPSTSAMVGSSSSSNKEKTL